jgi:hypothetical protein
MLRSDPKPGAPVHYQPPAPSPHEVMHDISLCREYWCKLTTEPSQVTCESCKTFLAFNVNLALRGGTS